MKHHLLVLGLLGIVFSSFGEVSYDPYTKGNPFESPIISTSSSNNENANTDSLVSTAGGKDFVGSHLVDTSNVPDVYGMEMRGRRQKSEDAITSGKSGVGAAISSGVALTASGIALLPWPTTPQGIALITLGSIEFAQAHATTGVNGQNTDGKNTLKNGTPTGQALSNEQIQEEIKKNINTPELQKALAENGVDSDSFINNLSSGSFSSPEDVMKALNIQADSNELKNAFDSAIANFSTHSQSVQDVLRLELEDKNKTLDSENPNLVHSFNRKGGYSLEGYDPYYQTENTISFNPKSFNTAFGKIEDRFGSINKELEKIIFKEKFVSGLTNNQKYQLHLLGIKQLRKKQNIFHVSRSTYRAYWKWIKTKENSQTGTTTSMLFR